MAGQLLSAYIHSHSSSKVCVVFGSVGCSICIGRAASTLQTSVDDHGCGTKAMLQVGGIVRSIGAPGALDHLQHAGLGWLGRHIEPHASGKVQPSGGHKPRVLKQHLCIAKHGLGEGSVVVVPAQLLCSSAKVLLTRNTWEGGGDPGRPVGTVVALVDLLQVEESCSLLLEVSKHARQDLRADRSVLANGRVLANGSQEVGVGVGGILVGEEIIELGLREDLLYCLDILRVCRRSGNDGLHQAVVQSARCGFPVRSNLCCQRF